MLVISEYC